MVKFFLIVIFFVVTALGGLWDRWYWERKR